MIVNLNLPERIIKEIKLRIKLNPDERDAIESIEDFLADEEVKLRSAGEVCGECGYEMKRHYGHNTRVRMDCPEGRKGCVIAHYRPCPPPSGEVCE